MIFLLMVIYSIFVPLKLGTVWFYTGLPIYLLGLISYAMVFLSFARTPANELVTKGIYRYSRNPMQISMFVLLLAAGIAAESWIFLMLAILFTIIPLVWLSAEERHLLKFYGETYCNYKHKTPKWIGIPKQDEE
jgi:protein-S-isoprenylcysteine O-methyltransferase Ste14